MNPPGSADSAGAATTRSIVVTGASRGWGRAIAVRFARPGAHIFVNYVHNEEMAQSVVAEIETSGATAVAVRADLGSAEGVDSLMDVVSSETGRVDVLVHNAYAHLNGPPLETSTDTLERCMAVGPHALLRAVGRAVELMPAGGRIICTGSVATRRVFTKGGTGYFPMAMAKAALETSTVYLAVDLAARDITVNMVVAGFIETEWVMDNLAPGLREKLARRTPLDRLATTEEMANVVHFLGSPEASWITGQVITADGGFTLL